MRISGTDLRARTKRQLVALLFETIESWSGEGPLGRSFEHRLRSILDELEQRHLFTAERHILNMCSLWVAEGCRKPQDDLRHRWLEAVSDWLSYMQEHPLFADENPGFR